MVRKLKINNKTITITMIKKYEQFINEDIRGKNIRIPDVRCDNLKSQYPRIQLRYNDDLKIVISCDKELSLNNNFYEALERDHIKKDDIMFENCEKITVCNIGGFVKISDYGVFGEDIKNFNCRNYPNLTSLEGAPKKVGGDFICRNCPNLTSLKGAPDVCQNFSCSNCSNLTSLEGAPKKVGGSFYCTGCSTEFIKLAIEKYGSKIMIY